MAQYTALQEKIFNATTAKRRQCVFVVVAGNKGLRKKYDSEFGIKRTPFDVACLSIGVCFRPYLNNGKFY